jgi:hypothetical protein
VVIGWTIIGLLVEAYGFWLLFCEFLPVVLQYSKQIPVLGKALDVPWLKSVSACRFCNQISVLGKALSVPWLSLVGVVAWAVAAERAPRPAPSSRCSSGRGHVRWLSGRRGSAWVQQPAAPVLMWGGGREGGWVRGWGFIPPSLSAGGA